MALSMIEDALEQDDDDDESKNLCEAIRSKCTLPQVPLPIELPLQDVQVPSLYSRAVRASYESPGEFLTKFYRPQFIV